jgi:hypothetical protein
MRVSVQASNKSAANSPVKPSAPEGPARMVLAVPDGCWWKRTKRSGRKSAKLYVSSGSTEGPKDPSTSARGRWGDSNRIAPGKAPVLRDESAAVVAKQRHTRERLLVFLYGITFFLHLSHALAQEPTNDDDQARQMFEAGRTAYVEGRYREAATLFQQSYGLSHRPLLLINVGNAWLKLDERDRAASAFREYLRLVPDAPDKAVLEARIKDLEAMPVLSAENQPKQEVQTPKKRQRPFELLAGRTWTWVALAGSAAFGATAIGFWIDANSRYSTLEKTCGKEPNGCSEKRINEVSDGITVTNWMLGLSITSFVAAAVLWFVEGEIATEAEQSSSSTVTVSISDRLLLTGRF